MFVYTGCNIDTVQMQTVCCCVCLGSFSIWSVRLHHTDTHPTCLFIALTCLQNYLSIFEDSLSPEHIIDIPVGNLSKQISFLQHIIVSSPWQFYYVEITFCFVESVEALADVHINRIALACVMSSIADPHS